MKQVSAAVIGGGPAGLAAAVRLRQKGIKDIVILEREKRLGGILRQCIHDGFGLTRFKEALSGPEYAQRYIDMAREMEIPCITDTTVLEITPDKRIYASSGNGLLELQAKAVILAMGCRERTRGAVSIPGERPSGVYTAGMAQAYINLHNKMVGKEAVILGSGDIGMIMARRLTLEGAHVQAVFEIQPFSSGLPRNQEQCLKDYHIPLYLSHTVTDILGRERLEGVVVSLVDEHMQPVPGTGKTYACDTLILSVGLIPENELSLGAGITLDEKTKGPVVDENYQTDVEGIFAAGNVLQVHDLVDFVSGEAERLGDAAAEYLRRESLPVCGLEITGDEHITHTIPGKISGRQSFCLSLRVRHPMKDCQIQVVQGSRVIRAQPLKKANPAEMIQIPVDASDLNSREKVEVKVKC